MAGTSFRVSVRPSFEGTYGVVVEGDRRSLVTWMSKRHLEALPKATCQWTARHLAESLGVDAGLLADCLLEEYQRASGGAS